MYEVFVTEDRLEARLRRSPDAEGQRPSEREIVQYLNAYGIVEVDRAAVSEFLERFEETGEKELTVVVARGRPPVDGEDAQIAFCDALRHDGSFADADGLRVDFRDRTKFRSVTQGDILATVTPATPGDGGRDVLGKPFPFRRGAEHKYRCGRNVVLSDDGTVFRAAVDGIPVLDGNQIDVKPVLSVDKDVDFETGNIVFPSDVVIGGTVRSGFKVEGGGNVQVGDCVEGATIQAGGDVTVSGGIVAGGSVTAKGNVTARFLENAAVRSGGDVVVEDACINSCVVAGGRLMVSGRKGIIGGHITVAEGLGCGALGSVAGVRTEVVAGVDMETMKTYAALENERRELEGEIARIRAETQSVDVEAHELSAAERERVMEQYFRIEEARTRLDALRVRVEEIKHEMRRTLESSAIEVRDTIYAGVTIRMGGASRDLKADVTGPVCVHYDVEERAIAIDEPIRSHSAERNADAKEADPVGVG